jgi:hypothetical protein
MKKNSILFGLLFLLAACSDMKMKPQATTHQYFDMASFMKKELTNLETSKCKARKIVASNGVKEVIESKEVDWKQELALFVETDINKPVLKDMYLINTNKDFIEYTALENKAKVQRLAVYGSLEKPTEIQVALIDENQLYQTKKSLAIKFENGRVVSYMISGQQKVVFKDAMTYELNAEVVY